MIRVAFLNSFQRRLLRPSEPHQSDVALLSSIKTVCGGQPVVVPTHVDPLVICPGPIVLSHVSSIRIFRHIEVNLRGRWRNGPFRIPPMEVHSSGRIDGIVISGFFVDWFKFPSGSGKHRRKAGGCNAQLRAGVPEVHTPIGCKRPDAAIHIDQRILWVIPPAIPPENNCVPSGSTASTGIHWPLQFMFGVCGPGG